MWWLFRFIRPDLNLGSYHLKISVFIQIEVAIFFTSIAIVNALLNFSSEYAKVTVLENNQCASSSCAVGTKKPLRHISTRICELRKNKGR